MRFRFVPTIFLALATAAILFAGCGGDEGQPANSTGNPSQANGVEAQPANNTENVILAKGDQNQQPPCRTQWVLFQDSQCTGGGLLQPPNDNDEFNDCVSLAQDMVLVCEDRCTPIVDPAAYAACIDPCETQYHCDMWHCIHGPGECPN
jgi:hypothetical protein